MLQQMAMVVMTMRSPQSTDIILFMRLVLMRLCSVYILVEAMLSWLTYVLPRCGGPGLVVGYHTTILLHLLTYNLVTDQALNLLMSRASTEYATTNDADVQCRAILWAFN
jgi:hypothetical protein